MQRCINYMLAVLNTNATQAKMYPSSHMKTIVVWKTNHCKLSNANGRQTAEELTWTCCLYHVQFCSNFTIDCKIIVFTSRSNSFTSRSNSHNLVWEQDRTTTPFSSIWSSSGGKSGSPWCDKKGRLLWNGQTAIQSRSADGSGVNSYCLCVLWIGGAQQLLVLLTWHSPVWEG